DTAEAADPRDRHLPAIQPGPTLGEQVVQRRVDDERVDRPQQKDERVDRPPQQDAAKPIAPITRMADAGVSRESAAPAPDGVEGTMEARIQSPGGGRPLPEPMRRDMESGLGADFSNVRVHDTAGDRADADHLNAKAFTHGSNIWIGSSGSANDRQL